MEGTREKSERKRGKKSLQIRCKNRRGSKENLKRGDTKERDCQEGGGAGIK